MVSCGIRHPVVSYKNSQIPTSNNTKIWTFHRVRDSSSIRLIEFVTYQFGLGAGEISQKSDL